MQKEVTQKEVMKKEVSLVQELPEGILNLMDACKCGCGLETGSGGGSNCGWFAG